MKRTGILVRTLICAIILLTFVKSKEAEGAIPDCSQSLTNTQCKPKHNNVKCHPTGDSERKNYIIGYGSLMKTSEKDRTYPNTGQNIPVMVRGFRRSWNTRGFRPRTTYLGVEKEPESSFNAVIFQIVSNVSETLQSFDNREEYYCRVKLNYVNLQCLLPNCEHISRDNDYWIYVTEPQFAANPDKHFPIFQSYLDKFLSGCLEIRDKFHLIHFAQDCVESTADWSVFWINDRYPRTSLLIEPQATRIDQLLLNVLKKQFAETRID